MNTTCIHPDNIDDQATNLLAMKALDKIITSHAPKILVWDPRSLCIRTVSVDAAYADRMRGMPTCLGTYDFDTRIEHIIDDLKAVWGLR